MHHSEASIGQVLRRQVWQYMQCVACRHLVILLRASLPLLAVVLTRSKPSLLISFFSCFSVRDALLYLPSSVPIIKHVKEMCDPFIKDYDACVMKNQEDPSICLDSLKRLFHCTEEHGKLPPSGPPRASSSTESKEGDKPTAGSYGYRGGA